MAVMSNNQPTALFSSFFTKWALAWMPSLSPTLAAPITRNSEFYRMCTLIMWSCSRCLALHINAAFRNTTLVLRCFPLCSVLLLWFQPTDLIDMNCMFPVTVSCFPLCDKVCLTMFSFCPYLRNPDSRIQALLLVVGRNVCKCLWIGLIYL